MDNKYTKFQDLPKGFQDRILKNRTITSPGDWVHQSIPALNNRSVIKLMNEDGGSEKVWDFLFQLESKFR